VFKIGGVVRVQHPVLLAEEDIHPVTFSSHPTQVLGGGESPDARP
jgi:hypothetical protein